MSVSMMVYQWILTWNQRCMVGRMAIEWLVGPLLSAMTYGMILFLVSVGLTIIFGILDIINFAHGSLYMIGAYVAFYAQSLPGSSFLVILVVAAVAVALLGGLIEWLVIRRIYDHDHIFQLILMFGVLLVLDNGARLVWGTDFKTISTPAALDFQLFGFPAYNMALILVGGAFYVLMWYTFERTRYGKMAKAAAEDSEVANAHGINVPRLYTAIFILGAALAGLSGALSAPWRTIHPGMGGDIIIEAFIVVIIGGFGSFSGALLGALLLGVVSVLSFNLAPSLQPVAPFLLLIAIIFAPFNLSDLTTANVRKRL